MPQSTTCAVRAITHHEAQELMRPAGLFIGGWANVTYKDEKSRANAHWRSIKAPSTSADLNAFSQKVIEWLPRPGMYILQFDRSNWLDGDQLFVFGKLLGCDGLININKGGAFCIDGETLSVMLLASYLVSFCLQFEGHAYLVSTTATSQNFIGLQDGYVYFHAAPGQDIPIFLEGLTAVPRTRPAWITEYNERMSPLK